MEIKTKFNIGDTVWTIRNCNLESFDVSYIGFDGNTTYYGRNVYDMLPESQCFPTKEAVIHHLTTVYED